jgi:hypothetical protein
MRTPICVALVVAALACAAWLREGRYPLGLDFQGGASVRVRVGEHGDAQKTLLHALAIRPRASVQIAGDSVEVFLDGGDADDVAALSRELAGDGEVRANVIDSAYPPWRGRPLATIIACAAALCWLGVLARGAMPSPPARGAIGAPPARGEAPVVALGLAGTFLLAWTVAVVDQLAIGGTLSIPLEVAGLLLGLAAAPAAWPRAGEPLERLRGAWPAAAALVLLLALSAVLVPHLLPRTHPIALHALRFVGHASVAVAAIGACAALASVKGSPGLR